MFFQQMRKNDEYPKVKLKEAGWERSKAVELAGITFHLATLLLLNNLRGRNRMK